MTAELIRKINETEESIIRNEILPIIGKDIEPTLSQMNMTSLDVLTDEVFGKEGTPKRDAMEKQLKEEVNAYFVGETIRKMRLAQNLTQEELGEREGV